MKQVILGLFCCAGLVMGQATVTITDTLKNPDGSNFNGSLTILLKYAGPLSTSSYSLTAGLKRVQVANGALSVTLTPNASITPAGTSYSVRYSPSGGSQSWDEIWVVPASPTPTTVRAIRSTTTPIPTVTLSPQQISTTGAVAGQAIIYNGSSIAWGNVTAGSVAWGTITGTVSAQSDLSPYVRGLISASSPLSYNSGTGVLSCPTCGIGAVTSVFGRTSAVVAQAGDYSGIYEPVDATILRSSGSYSNPTWLTGLAWSKITGAPSTYAPTAHASAHLAAGGDPLSLTIAEIAAGSRTAAGPRVATAAGVPADGCAEWASGQIGSSGSPCGTGGGTTSSVAGATQSFTAQTSVTVTHNFNSLRQIVGCYNGSAQWIQPNGVTTGLSSTAITFTEAQTGSCTVLGGTGLYSQAFTAQTSVSLTHSLGTQAVIVACYDGSNVSVDPSSVTATSTSAATVTFATAQTGSCVVASSLALTGGGGGSGTVTSVGLTLPSEFSVSGSPVTGAGTLAGSWATQTAGKVLAAPAASTGSPSFRALVLTDLPTGLTLSYLDSAAKTGNGTRAVTASSVPADGCASFSSGNLTSSGTACGSGGGGSYTAGDGIDATQLAASVVAVDTTVPAVAVSGSQSLTFGSISQSGCGVQAITATGAVIGDRVVPGYPATLPDGLMGMMFVSATNTVSVRLCKITAGSADVTGLTFTYQILRAR